MDRPRLVVLNKIDVPEARELAEFVRPELEERGLEVHLVSTATRENLRELSFAIAKVVDQARAAVPTETRSEEHTSELQSRGHLVCRLLLAKNKKNTTHDH